MICSLLARGTGAVKLECTFGNIDAQYTNSHVILPFQAEVLQSKAYSEGARRVSGGGGDGSLHLEPGGNSGYRQELP